MTHSKQVSRSYERGKKGRSAFVDVDHAAAAKARRIVTLRNRLELFHGCKIR